MATVHLYFLTFLISCAVTAVSLPLLRLSVGKYFLDIPTHIKKHSFTVPVLGGSAIFLGLTASLVFIRMTTHFPTGTLHSLRGILWGGGLIFLLGLADDLNKPEGVSSTVKLFVQSIAAIILMCYGIHISLFDWTWLSYILPFFWIIGITNAFNLLDIADGLCVSQSFICALGLLLIALPSEYIYVNFCACALLGACLGFWPYNHMVKIKTFLGDSGSMLLGFTLAALACGTGYSQNSNLGFLAPLFIFAIPIFATCFVALIRILKGLTPLKASNDHIAMRLRKVGLSQFHTLFLFVIAGLFFNILAFGLTYTGFFPAVGICLLAVILLLACAVLLAQIRIKS